MFIYILIGLLIQILQSSFIFPEYVRHGSCHLCHYMKQESILNPIYGTIKSHRVSRLIVGLFFVRK